MTKSLFASLIMLAGFVPLANSQVYSPHGWNSALNRAMAGPTAEYYARRALAPVDYAISNGYYGGYGRGGGRIGTIVGTAIGGAVIGGMVDGRRGALISAGGGALAGVALTASYRGGGHPLAGPSDQRRKGEDFQLANQIRFAVEVYFGKKGKGKYQGRLASGESWSVKGPKPNEKYSGYALIPNRSGGFSSDEAPIQPTADGWVFVEPDCVRQGK